ncbi:hypothetical protein E2C01_068767 [Portunus trituberculatus]|uniref:Uncharacterized protein n=1 Tax=Portunus trituberculatus TaxID=210409 RepID=A0A5B7HXC0_PORTR|nr:hypothetical protein [Portunus trituberculatus]
MYHRTPERIEQQSGGTGKAAPAPTLTQYDKTFTRRRTPVARQPLLVTPRCGGAARWPDTRLCSMHASHGKLDVTESMIIFRDTCDLNVTIFSHCP